MLSIHEQPFPPQDRSQAAHCEGDLITGKNQQSAIATLVERTTKSSVYCTFSIATATPDTPP
ncbi:hypothetical protein [Kribbella sp. CA-294648]|uniref:hypothetical protein n=1 Tax=Kribbella sp. CA-294648 TaxID=3239948 RepID=UPI003D919BEA